MEWDIEYTDEFGKWWDSLTEGEQESVRTSVKLLGDFGPKLPFPHSSGITMSQHGNMRELRIQHAGRPYRVLYAFDPRRCAVLQRGSVEKKPERTVGMKNTYQLQTGYIMNTWKHCARRA